MLHGILGWPLRPAGFSRWQANSVRERKGVSGVLLLLPSYHRLTIRCRACGPCWERRPTRLARSGRPRGLMRDVRRDARRCDPHPDRPKGHGRKHNVPIYEPLGQQKKTPTAGRRPGLVRSMRAILSQYAGQIRPCDARLGVEAQCSAENQHPCGGGEGEMAGQRGGQVAGERQAKDAADDERAQRVLEAVGKDRKHERRILVRALPMRARGARPARTTVGGGDVSTDRLGQARACSRRRTGRGCTRRSSTPCRSRAAPAARASRTQRSPPRSTCWRA